MLDYSSSEVMSRKEYLNKKKRNSNKFWYLKYILIALVILGLAAYLIYQLNVYKKVTEAAHSMMEEAKLLKTYKMVFMGKSYVKGGENIMYLYLGQDESRQKIDTGSGMHSVIVDGRYIYGLKDKNLYKIDLLDKTSELILEKEASAYYIYDDEVYIYEYRNGKSGLYKKIDGEFKEIIHAKIYQTQMTNDYIFTVEDSKEGKSIIKRDHTYGEGVKISGKDNVSNIRLVGDSIYYTNVSDGNKIYSIDLSGENRKCVTEHGAINEFAGLYFQQYIDVYKNNVLYVSKDNKLYMSSVDLEEDELLLDEKVAKIQLIENMLYVKLLDDLDVIRINLDTKEKEKITSIRSTDVYVFK
jgi:hypothetical protein